LNIGKYVVDKKFATSRLVGLNINHTRAFHDYNY